MPSRRWEVPSSRPLSPQQQLDVMRSQEQRREAALSAPSGRDLEVKEATITEDLLSLFPQSFMCSTTTRVLSCMSDRESNISLAALSLFEMKTYQVYSSVYLFYSTYMIDSELYHNWSLKM